MALQSGLAGLGPLLRLRGRARAPDGAGGASRLACRRIRPGTARPTSTPRSIGIEIANPGHPGGLPPFPDAQIESVDRACQGHRHPLATSRRPCARPFRRRSRPQARSRRALSLAASARGGRRPLGRPRRRSATGGSSPAATRACRSRRCRRCWPCTAIGLTITGVFDEDTEKVVAAFQRHFRPERVDGVADASTITTLQRPDRATGRKPAHDKELTRTSVAISATIRSHEDIHGLAEGSSCGELGFG